MSPQRTGFNTLMTRFLVVDATGNRRRESVFGGFRFNEWTHVAVVTGPGGVRLFLNGVPAMTNDFEGSLSSLGRDHYYLGRYVGLASESMPRTFPGFAAPQGQDRSGTVPDRGLDELNRPA